MKIYVFLEKTLNISYPTIIYSQLFLLSQEYYHKKKEKKTKSNIYYLPYNAYITILMSIYTIPILTWIENIQKYEITIIK